jgi:transposase-like protein
MTEADRRLTSRIARDHGLTPEQLTKAVKEQKRKPKGDRHSVGE